MLVGFQISELRGLYLGMARISVVQDCRISVIQIWGFENFSSFYLEKISTPVIMGEEPALFWRSEVEKWQFLQK